MRRIPSLPPPGWDASQLEITPLHFIGPPRLFDGIHLYYWVESGTVREKCFAHEHNIFTQVRLKPHPLHWESNALIID